MNSKESSHSARPSKNPENLSMSSNSLVMLARRQQKASNFPNTYCSLKLKGRSPGMASSFSYSGTKGRQVTISARAFGLLIPARDRSRESVIRFRHAALVTNPEQAVLALLSFDERQTDLETRLLFLIATCEGRTRQQSFIYAQLGHRTCHLLPYVFMAPKKNPSQYLCLLVSRSVSGAQLDALLDLLPDDRPWLRPDGQLTLTGNVNLTRTNHLVCDLSREIP